MLAICVQKGLVKGEKIYADATLVRANASIKSLTPRSDAPSPSISPREFIDKIFEDNQVGDDSKLEERAGQEPRGTALKGTSLYRDRDSSKLSHRDMPRVLRPKYRRRHESNIDYMSRTDPDASFIGRPGKGAFFCYKYHFIVDGDGRVVTSVALTPGAVPEEHMLADLLEKQPVMVGEVCADSQYGTAENYALCWRQGIKPSMPRRRVARKKDRIPQEEFTYVPDRDIYICPNGKELRRLTYDKRTRRWHYRPWVRDCRACPLKLKCCPRTTIRTFVRAVEQEFIDKTMEWLRTPDSQQSLKQRSMFAEWAVAEAKTLYGLGKARYRGLEKVTIQTLMTATVQNIKRLIALRNRIGTGSSLLFNRIESLLCWSGCSTPSFSLAHST